MTQSSPEPERSRSLVVDTSACIAVILGEPGSMDLAACLEHALVRLMPAAIRVELGIVIEARLWPAGQDVVDRFLRDAKIDIVAVDEKLATPAISGWRRYGKGRHPAALKFGECFTVSQRSSGSTRKALCSVSGRIARKSRRSRVSIASVR